MSGRGPLFEPSTTPRVDALVVSDEKGARISDIEAARKIERELNELHEMADRLAKAIQRSPFEAEENFGSRREIVFGIYQDFMARLKA